MEKTFSFKSSEIESSIEDFKNKGITEFTLQDEEILSHKGKLLKFLNLVEKKYPELFLTLPVIADVLDLDVCRAVSNLYCTLEIPLCGTSKGGTYLFDKKFYSRRAQTFNNLGLVFGFDMDFAAEDGDSVKLFRDRVDFALSLYPNHIDFPQLEKDSAAKMPKPTATFSTQDIQKMREVAYAIETFYSYGRAVTWFLSILKPLKMNASKFFQDFSEWQTLNNCGLESSWNVALASHSEIEKMQLEFLKFKYEEKNKVDLFTVVSNIVRLNGALSRCYGENLEGEVELNYNPDELLGGGAFDIQSFFDNSIIENSRVKVFMGGEGPEYHYV